ncbi:MAG TPA: polysaccharide biosynthesis tyrosine autokinase [Planctomycetaceae bacterium]|nr:polysaccharide biosynthesis tyrosine autokinase [Planctomycetaceae bacterium]
MSASSPWPTEAPAGSSQPSSLESASEIDLTRVLFGQKLLTMFLVLVGVGCGYYLFTKARPVYSSSARVRVFQPRPMTTAIDGRTVATTAPQLDTFAILITSPNHLREALRNLRDGDLKGASGEAMLGYVANGLSVQPGSAKEFLDFTFNAPYPQDCPIVLGAVVQAFTEYLETSQQGDTKKAVEFIDDARKLLDLDLKKKQDAYNEFKATSSLVFVGEKAKNLHQERMSQIETTRSNLLIQETQLRAELDAIEAAIAKNVSRETLLLMVDTANRQRKDADGSPAESLSSLLLPLIFEEEKLLQSLGSGHPRVREVRRKIELTRAMFEQGASSEAGSDKPRGDWLDIYVDSLRQGLSKISQQKTDLNSLFEKEQTDSRRLAKQENEDQSYRDDIDRTSRLFDTVLDQLQALNLAKDSGTLKAEVVSPPGPGWQVGPAYSKYLGGGGIVGWLAAICISFLIESSNGGFRGLDDVTRRLKLPVLGTIPVIESRTLRGKVRSKAVARMGVCFHKPASFAAEAYRAVRSAIFLGSHGSNIHVLLITSSEAGAGKSTLAANLAISIAQSGKRCLLVDADCRRPTQHELFGVGNNVGLMTVLQDSVDFPDAIVRTDVEHLDLLPSGQRTDNPAELLMADEFRSFLLKMRETYEFIIIDSPPVLAVTDASIISPAVDGVLFVSRLGRSARVLCARGLDRLRLVGAKVIGIALNAVRLEGSGYGAGQYHYGYHYGNTGNADYFKEAPAPKAVTTVTQK